MSTIERQPIQQLPTPEQAAQDQAVINDAIDTAEASGSQPSQPEATVSSPAAAPAERPESMLARKGHMPAGFENTKIEYIDGVGGREKGPRNRRIISRRITAGGPYR